MSTAHPQSSSSPLSSSSAASASISTLHGDENVLEFEMAMSHFKSMFPNIDSTTIEKVLRSHNGDVTNTINELLCLSANSSHSSSSNSTALQVGASAPPYASSSNCHASTSSHCGSASTSNRYGSASSSNTFNANDNDEESAFYENERSPGSKKKSSSASDASYKREATRSSTSSEKNGREETSCVDDEKIALLMQNREFLAYLQSDARFMQEIGGYDASSLQYHPNPHRHYRGRPWQGAAGYRNLPHAPIMEMTRSGVWRQCAPPTGYSYGGRHYDYSISGAGSSDLYDTPYRSSGNSSKSTQYLQERPTALPDGPLIDFADGSIPKGPLIDYSNGQQSSSSSSTAKNWSQKVKSHLPLVGKSAKHSNDNSLVNAPGDHYDAANNAPFVDYSVAGDENFAHRLRDMSKSSKTLLLSLARKFSHSRKPSFLSNTSHLIGPPPSSANYGSRPTVAPTNVDEQNQHFVPYSEQFSGDYGNRNAVGYNGEKQRKRSTSTSR